MRLPRVWLLDDGTMPLLLARARVQLFEHRGFDRLEVAGELDWLIGILALDAGNLVFVVADLELRELETVCSRNDHDPLTGLDGAPGAKLFKCGERDPGVRAGIAAGPIRRRGRFCQLGFRRLLDDAVECL